MDIGVYSIRNVGDAKIRELVSAKQSFVLEDISRLNMVEAVTTLEKTMESLGFRSRVYTKGRAVSMAMAAVPTPAMLWGWAAGIGIGVHNLVTFNPDYEIAKNLATGTLTVTYKKS